MGRMDLALLVLKYRIACGPDREDVLGSRLLLVVYTSI